MEKNSEAKLKDIKALIILSKIFEYIDPILGFKLLQYSKHFQNKFKADIERYKEVRRKYIKEPIINGPGKEYSLDSDNVVFEGEYLNGKKNGQGKEYTHWGNKLLFEGNYLNGRRSGLGKEYYNDIKLFDGEYLRGERFEEKNTKIKNNYYYGDKIEYEGNYSKGKKNGEGKEYYYTYKEQKIKFEGEYLNGLRWNGKGYDIENNIYYELKNGNGKIKEYYINGDIKFEGECLRGLRNGKGIEYLYHYGPLEFDYKPYFEDGSQYDSDKYVFTGFHYTKIFKSFEGEYSNGLRHGKGKEFYTNGKIKFEGEYLKGKRWKGKGYNINGNIEYGIKDGYGFVKDYFSDGSVQFEGKYVNGEKNGKAKEYDIDYRVMNFWQCETIENKEFYYLLFDGNYLNGKRQGKAKEYNIQNLIEFEGEYKNGKRNGKGKIYYTDGTIYFEGDYLNGKIKHGKEYGDNNTIIFEGDYLNGEKINGKIYNYYKDGKIKLVGELLNGKKWNVKGYDKNNKIIFELKEGKGFFQEFSNNDELKYEGQYLNGERNGKGKEYNYDNKIEFKGEYLNGERWNGIEYDYSYSEGKLKYGEEYLKGENTYKKIEFNDGKNADKLPEYETEKEKEEKKEYNLILEKLNEEEEKNKNNKKDDESNNNNEKINDEKNKENKEENKEKKEENNIPEFIKKYGKEKGINGLKLNYDNFCVLTFDGTIEVKIQYYKKENLCSFVSAICPKPKNDKEKIYEELLCSNAFGYEGACAFSLDEKINYIVLSFTFIANTFSYELFKNVLNSFVSVSEKPILKFKNYRV